MKSFRSYLTKLDRSKQISNNLDSYQPVKIGQEPTNNSTQKLYQSLFATTLVVSSQLLAVMSASSNPIPTPSQPLPVVPTRTVLNGSFEKPAQKSVAPGYGINESYNNNGDPIIWRTTEPGNRSGTYKDQLEIWRGVNTNAGGQSNASGAGDQYAEINASTNASIYQDLCVLPNETIGWSLLHAARKNSGYASGNPTNKMQVSITNPVNWLNSKTPPATKLYNSGDLSTKYNDGWKLKTGTWTSSITSISPLRFAFQAIEGSNDISYGNFIDNVNLSLSPIIDFLPTGDGNVNLDSTTEGNKTNYYFLSLRVNGIMKTAGSVKIKLTGLHEKRKFKLANYVAKGSGGASVTGLTASQSGKENGDVITLNIPAGTYDPNVPSDYIHIPIDFSDKIAQPNDNLVFTLSNPTGGGTTVAPAVSDLQIASTSCAGSARDKVNVYLLDDEHAQRVQLPTPITVATNQSK